MSRLDFYTDEQTERAYDRKRAEKRDRKRQRPRRSTTKALAMIERDLGMEAGSLTSTDQRLVERI